ncbi:MAG: hypothetical protein HY273_17190 [Gammaproteobacteria bacterium]|nr:hypothetical protein [Gammaproteobacteria bacterium]
MTTEAARMAELSELLQHGYRYALSLTHHKTRAEDLLQDAWVAVLQARGAPANARYRAELDPPRTAQTASHVATAR